MNTEDFKAKYWELDEERRELIGRRTDLETELVEVRNKITHLDEVLSHLAPLADLPFYEDDTVSGLGITDAIRYVLKMSDERLSAQDVRQQLSAKGYDLSPLTAPMASIYKILGRIEESGEVIREKEEGRVYYKWKNDGPISDEDIPF